MHCIEVKPALESETAACAAVLPEAAGSQAQYLIARLDGAFAGAAALIWRSEARPAGFPIWAQVLPAWRRRGVGRRLVCAAQDLARGETAGLWSLESVREDGAAAAFLRACGFEVLRRQHHFIADVDPLLENIAPMLSRLRRRDRIPPGARVVPLADAPLDKVGWLVSAELGSGPLRVIERLRTAAGAGGPSRRERSIVAMDGDDITGVLICSVRDGVGVVDGWVTAPSWRGGWTNLLLLEAILTRGKADDFESFRFYCDDTVKDTMKLAVRSGASETATLSLFYRQLATTP